jgi:hypothetical protein
MAASHNDDDLAAGILDLFGDTTGITFPVYGPAPHCNQRGLSVLGQQGLVRMMQKGMLFDPDHMSVLARNRALDIIEGERYPGVMTSHSWSTENALPRISRLGGLIGPSAKSPQKFVSDWEDIRAHGYDDLNPYTFGFAYGADMNGFASQGGPPPAEGQFTYPFQSPIDPTQTIHAQKSGTFTFDYNTLGTAHYGLYADWGEAVRRVAEARDPGAGAEIIADMKNGAEAYLDMWERTEDFAQAGGPGQGGNPDAGGGSGQQQAAGVCSRWPRKFNRLGLAMRLRVGDDEQGALLRAGPPERRNGDAMVWCAQDKNKKKKKRKTAAASKRRVAAVFEGGKVALVASTLSRSKAGPLRRGTRLAAVRLKAKTIGNGLWVRDAGPDTVYFVRVKKGRVKYTGVAQRSLARPSVLRAKLNLTGLG